MDTIQVIIKEIPDSLHVAEITNLQVWTIAGIVLISAIILIIFSILVYQRVSYCHEYRMYKASRPQVIVNKTCYILKHKHQTNKSSAPLNNSNNNQNNVGGVDNNQSKPDSPK